MWTGHSSTTLHTTVVRTTFLYKLRKNGLWLHCPDTFGEKLLRMLEFAIFSTFASFANRSCAREPAAVVGGVAPYRGQSIKRHIWRMAKCMSVWTTNCRPPPPPPEIVQALPKSELVSMVRVYSGAHTGWCSIYIEILKLLFNKKPLPLKLIMLFRSKMQVKAVWHICKPSRISMKFILHVASDIRIILWKF